MSAVDDDLHAVRLARTAKAAATVAAPAAITSAAAVAAPTKGEYDALRTDHVNLRTAFTNLLTSLKSAGLVQ